MLFMFLLPAENYVTGCVRGILSYHHESEIVTVWWSDYAIVVVVIITYLRTLYFSLFGSHI